MPSQPIECGCDACALGGVIKKGSRLPKDREVECYQCRTSYHIQCIINMLNIGNPSGDSLHEAMKVPGARWYCETCNIPESPSVCNTTIDHDVMKEVKEGFEMVRAMATKIDKLESELDAMIIAGVSKVVEEKKADNDDEKWSTVVGKAKKKKAKDPVMLVKPLDRECSRSNVRKSLNEAVDATNYIVNGVSNAAGNGLVIRCENDEECDKLVADLKAKIGETHEIRRPAHRLPRFKMLRLVYPNADDATFIETLKKNNPRIKDENCKFEIIKREQVRVKGRNVDGCFNLVIQTDGETFNKVMSEPKLRIGFDGFKVVDNIYIRRCYKCLGFNHISTECKAEIACSICSGPHNMKDCTSKEEKCVNCSDANNRLKSNIPVNHNAWARDCPIYKMKLAASKRAISYVQ